MNSDESNLAALLKQLRDDTTTLVREEIALAKTEAAEKLSKLARNSVILVAGALLGYAALTPLLLGLGFLLGSLLTSWGLGSTFAAFLGFLAVALIVGAISAAVVLHALNALKKDGLMPRRTIDSLKEDKEWIQKKLP